MELLPIECIATRILCIRNQRVIIDTDLAELYGVPTKALNQAIKRNKQRFPSDFMFQVTTQEKLDLVTNCDHLAKLKFSKSLPYVFTEHGAIQAANVLNSTRAVTTGIVVVRAFVQLRNVALSHQELQKKLESLEKELDYRLDRQDETIEGIMAALRQLMTPPEHPKRPIGFIYPDD